MEKIPMDPLVNKDTWKIEGYQYRLKFPEDTVTSADIENILNSQQNTNPETWKLQWSGYVGEWFV